MLFSFRSIQQLSEGLFRRHRPHSQIFLNLPRAKVKIARKFRELGSLNRIALFK
jgi:hypothetical protein